MSDNEFSKEKSFLDALGYQGSNPQKRKLDTYLFVNQWINTIHTIF
jgi:hypothetical protein